MKKPSATRIWMVKAEFLFRCHKLSPWSSYQKAASRIFSMTALWLLWLLMVLTSHSGRIERGKSIIILQVFSFASFYCNQLSISEGSNYGFHVCDCHYETEGCIEEETRYNTCNCDANLPITQTDTGIITNTSALPVVKLFFGGMNYELQYATFKLGRLKCHGTKELS